MNKIAFSILVLLFCLDVSAAKKAKKKIIAPRPKENTVEEKSKLPVAPIVYEDRFYRYRLNTILGLSVVQRTALVTGIQFGFAPKNSTPFYLGPEFNFSLFSSGSVLAILAGALYELQLKGPSKVTISIGTAIGPGFNSALSKIPATPLIAFFDVALAQEMDDLVNIRAQFRPGIIGKFFVFMMNFNVSFRFL